jgi:hypothetical protein
VCLQFSFSFNIAEYGQRLSPLILKISMKSPYFPLICFVKLMLGRSGSFESLQSPHFRISVCNTVALVNISPNGRSRRRLDSLQTSAIFSCECYSCRFRIGYRGSLHCKGHYKFRFPANVCIHVKVFSAFYH